MSRNSRRAFQQSSPVRNLDNHSHLPLLTQAITWLRDNAAHRRCHGYSGLVMLEVSWEAGQIKRVRTREVEDDSPSPVKEDAYVARGADAKLAGAIERLQGIDAIRRDGKVYGAVWMFFAWRRGVLRRWKVRKEEWRR